MIEYKIKTDKPHRHFLQFEAAFATHGREKIQLQLAAWRPGRYELGNFSKNIRKWRAIAEDGAVLSFRKITKDLWEVDCGGRSIVRVEYQYYAAELNAGSTFFDEEQVYINPVNCFFFDASFADQPYLVNLDIPANYTIACGLEKRDHHVLFATNYDQLADCPLIASATIKHRSFTVEDTNFHVWIQGDIAFDLNKFCDDLNKFTTDQIRLFGSIPCNEYHYLFHFTAQFQRHGVEHCNSTAIAMGPASDFQFEAQYKDLLGISCHELFHTWNVKNIRPSQMMPYNFTRENYTQLGYVAEGVTTYYGDLMLWQNNSFSATDWYEIIADHIKTHLDNPGRFNLSVAESSFDTWLDGYSAGIPWRKVSIYNEGFLIAFITDVFIMHSSECKHSLDDVMRDMYHRFGLTGIGYTDDDYMSIVNHYGSENTKSIFERLVYSTEDYLPFLNKALEICGLEITTSTANKWSENTFGFSTEETNGKIVVSAIAEDGPADNCGLWIGDEIVAVNGTAFGKNFQSLLRSGGSDVQLEIVQRNKRKQIKLIAGNKPVMQKISIQPKQGVQETQVFAYWKNRLAQLN